MLKNDGSVQKLKQIVANRYGKGLEFRALTDVSASVADEELVEKGDDLLIPLRVKAAFLGTAVILRGAELEGDQRQQIAQVVRMVLEPSLYRDFLERRETNLVSLVHTDTPYGENVRLFTEPSSGTFIDQDDEDEDEDDHTVVMEIIPGEDMEDVEDDDQIEPETPGLVAPILHVHSRDPQRAKKAALLLHEMTGRFAFVPFTDLASGLESAADIARLGLLTIWIESIDALTPKQQQIIMAFNDSIRTGEEPLLVVGSNYGDDDLAKVESLSPDLREELTVNSLDLDRAPLTDRGLREVLSLMFFETRGEA